ncbi:MAG: hypothetical protein ACK5Y6_00560 [Pseudomonadota bacterium]|jgi:hypothetical protein
MMIRAVLVLALFVAGCGRYRPPLTPEMLAPSAVESLVVVPSEQGVSFSWVASDKDRRGKELKSAEGFSIERKELTHKGDETDPSVEFKKLGFVKDRHVEERDRLRVEARAAGKVGRTVKSPEQFTKFSFNDKTAARGKTYLYQIVPHNQSGTEGQIGQMVKVVFQGAQSSVVIQPSQEVLDQLQLAGAAPVM